MKINILTLFPDMFCHTLGQSIIGRARENKILEINIINIRDYTEDKHNKADDTPFGGGQGMVMSAQPIFDAIQAVCQDNMDKKKMIYMSPRGKVLNHDKLLELAEEQEILILCGHYEGIDQRVIDYFEMEEISIGDYVLTGGELPAMVLVDSLARLVPGVLSSEASANEESIYSGLIEYPQYTKPRNFRGLDVPEILVSGNHKLIELWKFEQSLLLTKERRPDLFSEFLKKADLLDKDHKKILEKILS